MPSRSSRTGKAPAGKPKPPPDFSAAELKAMRAIVAAFRRPATGPALKKLCALKDATYAAIPARQRPGRGITWVLQRLSQLAVAVCPNEADLKMLSLSLQTHLAGSDLLVGMAFFLMAAYGQNHVTEVLPFFAEAAAAENWIVREFAAAAFRPLIAQHPAAVRPWLQKAVRSRQPYVRRFASETLRPVVTNQWLQHTPAYSLGLLKWLFQEAHPYPRTSVGNNLSDLSKAQPELIFAVVEKLVALKDPNSYWIAYRACRNLVKKQPDRVLQVLGLEAYHYKDRHAYRARPTSGAQRK